VKAGKTESLEVCTVFLEPESVRDALLNIADGMTDAEQ